MEVIVEHITDKKEAIEFLTKIKDKVKICDEAVWYVQVCYSKERLIYKGISNNHGILFFYVFKIFLPFYVLQLLLIKSAIKTWDHLLEHESWENSK